MVVAIYPICEVRGIWSFRPQPGATPVRVRVPKGSVLREVKTVGATLAMLFVPNPKDKVFLGGWEANHVMADARQSGRFKLVGEGKGELAVG